jgi:RNA polymerase sigma-32 factor
MLTQDEEYRLAKGYKEHGDRDAADHLVAIQLGLVAKIAMGSRGYGLPISELNSEGNVGLTQAVKRTEDDVVSMNRRLGRDASLDRPLRTGGEGGGEWLDWLVDESPDQEQRRAEIEEADNRRRVLREAMSAFNDRERRVFEARVLAEEPISLQELSGELGVSHRRVHQIELHAFDKVANDGEQQCPRARPFARRIVCGPRSP